MYTYDICVTTALMVFFWDHRDTIVKWSWVSHLIIICVAIGLTCKIYINRFVKYFSTIFHIWYNLYIYFYVLKLDKCISLLSPPLHSAISTLHNYEGSISTSDGTQLWTLTLFQKLRVSFGKVAPSQSWIMILCTRSRNKTRNVKGFHDIFHIYGPKQTSGKIT